jgi:DNA-binding NtrC family response regulator
MRGALFVTHPSNAPLRRILVVDDQDGMRSVIRDHFAGRGWIVSEAATVRDARERFAEGTYDAILSDLLLPDGEALQLLPTFKSRDRHLPVLFLTGYGTIDVAVRAMRAGADQFLTKPVELHALELMVLRLLDEAAARRPDRARPLTPPPYVLDPFAGTSAAIRRLREEARRIAVGEGPVLITGETGSGKGVLAGWIHAQSARADAPYVDLNCAGLARESLESECFGHVRGAFTGAVVAKPGLFEIAHRGTVFLDEIGDTDVEVQAKLLKVIEEKRFRRMGDVRFRTVDVRIIAATHQDLGARMQRGAFRQDLYYRISTLPLRIPPLRERAEDIPLLVEAFLSHVAAEAGRPELTLMPEAMHELTTYSWPGNIRELRNVLVRGALLSPGEAIRREDLLFDSRVPVGLPISPDMTLEEVERRYIERVLHEEGGHVERAARRLGLSRSTLYEMIKRQGLRRSEL